MKKPFYERRNKDREVEEPNRRKYPRMEMKTDCYYDSELQNLFLNNINITLRGAWLKTSMPDPIDTECTIRIEIPERSNMLKIKGKVIWSSKVPDKKTSRGKGMGISFINMNKDDKEELAKHIFKNCGIEAFPQFAKKYKNIKS